MGLLYSAVPKGVHKGLRLLGKLNTLNPKPPNSPYCRLLIGQPPYVTRGTTIRGLNTKNRVLLCYVVLQFTTIMRSNPGN